MCVQMPLKVKENPVLSNSKDDLLLQFIRQANIDAFLSRASSRVYNNRHKGTIAGMVLPLLMILLV